MLYHVALLYPISCLAIGLIESASTLSDTNNINLYITQFLLCEKYLKIVGCRRKIFVGVSILLLDCFNCADTVIEILFWL